MSLDPRQPVYLAVSAQEWARIQRENRIPGTARFYTSMGTAETVASSLNSDTLGHGVVIKFELFLLTNTYRIIEESEGVIRVASTYIEGAISRITGFFEVKAKTFVDEVEDFFGFYAHGV